MSFVHGFSGSSSTTAQGLATTGHDSDIFNVSPENPYLNQTGVGSSEVQLTDMGKYQIDIFGDLQSFNPQDTPLLTILTTVGKEGMSAPEATWIDEYEGQAWADTKLDDLREANKVSADSTTVYGGRLAWEEVTTWPSVGSDLALGGSVLKELALEENASSAKVLRLGFDTGSDYIRGKKSEFIRKIANLLDINEYDDNSSGEYGSDTSADATTYYEYEYSSGTSRAVSIAFEDLAIAVGSTSTYYQKHEVVARIEKFTYNLTLTEFAIEINFDESNIWDILSNTASENTVLVEEVCTGGSAASRIFDSEIDGHDGFYTRISRLAMIGNVTDVPSGIAEGQNFSDGGNYIFGQDQYRNLSQIFASKKYGITGTRQATQVRFKDDWAQSRRRHLSDYKQRITAAMMFGRQSITYDSEGMPKRTMSGIFDYELFPIRYLRSPIPSIQSETFQGSAFSNWLNDLAYALNSFKQKGSNTITFLASQDVINQVYNWITYVGTLQGNILGALNQQSPPASSATMGLRVTRFTTNYGDVSFVHEPALDYMPKLSKSTESTTAGSGRGGAPSHLFANGLNPRKVLLAVDKAHIKFLTLRGDKIHGNIQDPGQDAFLEAMRGEHSMKLRFPCNHAVVDVS